MALFQPIATALRKSLSLRARHDYVEEKGIVALNQIARKIGMALLGIFRSAKNSDAEDQRRAAEEERLDRIRNPHKYGPGKL